MLYRDERSLTISRNSFFTPGISGAIPGIKNFSFDYHLVRELFLLLDNPVVIPFVKQILRELKRTKTVQNNIMQYGMSRPKLTLTLPTNRSENTKMITPSNNNTLKSQETSRSLNRNLFPDQQPSCSHKSDSKNTSTKTNIFMPEAANEYFVGSPLSSEQSHSDLSYCV